MDNSISYHKLTEENISEIQRIASYSFYKQWMPSDYKYFLNHPDGFCLGAYQDFEMLGYLLAMQLGDALDIISVATDIRYRRQGVSQKLIQRAFQCPGVAQLTLEVEADNAPAFGLYQKLGFRTLSRRKGYYDGIRDAFRMSKSL